MRVSCIVYFVAILVSFTTQYTATVSSSTPAGTGHNLCRCPGNLDDVMVGLPTVTCACFALLVRMHPGTMSDLPDTGLHLTINIDQDEYVSAAGETAGLRLVVHSQDRMPFPEDEGTSVVTGRATCVAVRKVGQMEGSLVLININSQQDVIFIHLHAHILYLYSLRQRTLTLGVCTNHW